MVTSIPVSLAKVSRMAKSKVRSLETHLPPPKIGSAKGVGAGRGDQLGQVIQTPTLNLNTGLSQERPCLLVTVAQTGSHFGNFSFAENPGENGVGGALVWRGHEAAPTHKALRVCPFPPQPELLSSLLGLLSTYHFIH